MEILDEMRKAQSDVKRNLRQKIKDIIALAEAYSYMGDRFTFDNDKALNDGVNAKLVNLVNSILEDADTRVDHAIAYALSEVHSSSIVSYVYRTVNGKTPTNRMDYHASRLKWILEGWIAIGFVNKLSGTDLINHIMSYLAYPKSSALWNSALKSERYVASILKDGDLNMGKGIQSSIVDSLSLIEETMINEAYQYGKIMGYDDLGARWYGVRRGSSFDCPVCDEVCSVIHSIDDIVVPVHPRCVCITYPIFE